MKRLLSDILLIILCVFPLSCHHEDKTTYSEKNLSLYASDYYLKDLYKPSTTPVSELKAIRELLTDSMRWWGLDIVYCDTNASELEEINRHHLEKINLAKKWCKNNKSNDFIKGKIWNQKGLYYINIYQMDSAIVCFKKAYECLSRTKAYNQLSTATINLASAYYRAGSVPKAAQYYKRAALISDSLNCSINRFTIRIGLAHVYIDLQNFRMAQENLDDAKQYLSQATAYEKYFYHIACGICWYYKEKYDLAYQQFLAAAKLARKHSSIQQVLCQACLGETAMSNHQPELALSHIDYCLNFLKEIPKFKYKTIEFYICSLSAHVLLANGKVAEARQLLKRLPDDHEVKMLRYLSLHYCHMAKYEESRKNYRQALKYNKIAEHYKNSLNNENAINNLIEIGQKYQRDTTLLKQNITIANIEKENSQYQLRLSLVIGGLCLVISFCFITIIIIRRKNDKIYVSKMEQIAKLRMDVVRNRISPHYIFNVLGMMLPKFKSNPELHQISELFIDVIRGNLIASSQLAIIFSEEKRLVRQYVHLYHKTTSPYPLVLWEDTTDGELDNTLIPTMCIQIPVENALKHAFTERDEHCFIKISALREKNRLILTIVDNGDGYNPGKVTPTGRDTGTGLKVLSSTIDLLNRQNSKTIGFHIHNRSKNGEKGTKVEISIPFDYQYTKEHP